MSLGAIEPRGTAVPSASRAHFADRGALRIFVQGDSYLASWRDAVRALASPAAPRSSLPARYFSREIDTARRSFDARPVLGSVLLHCSFVALVIFLPGAMPGANASRFSNPTHSGRIYYRVPLLNPVKMPRLAPAGPGGRPGSGSIPAAVPSLGSSAPRLNMAMVSKPVHADNAKQTIYQPSSPPELKITTDQKWPNVIALAKRPETPKTSLNLTLAKPTPANQLISAMASPTVNPSPGSVLPTLPENLATQAHPAMPLGGLGAPIRQSSDVTGNVAGGSADDPDVMVLGVDAAGSMSQLSMPGGNRWGEFSMAPSRTPGSPGGDPRGEVGGGREGGTLGGDGSAGIGFGERGGGGNSAGIASVSVAGPVARGGPDALLNPLLPANMVYAVPAPLTSVRKNALVISAGPIGGGGLNVYGALKCGRVYSIFLPMPGKNWSLQYCDKSAGPMKVESQGGTSIVHMDKPLVPPDFDLDHRFNFKRLPLPVEKSHRSIVLKGVIAADGTVQNLTVYQGVGPEMDEAARIAFSRWHFKPAMKDGKPIEVEVLVGIPPVAEEDRVNR